MEDAVHEAMLTTARQLADLEDRLASIAWTLTAADRRASITWVAQDGIPGRALACTVARG